MRNNRVKYSAIHFFEHFNICCQVVRHQPKNSITNFFQSPNHIFRDFLLLFGGQIVDKINGNADLVSRVEAGEDKCQYFVGQTILVVGRPRYSTHVYSSNKPTQISDIFFLLFDCSLIYLQASYLLQRAKATCFHSKSLFYQRSEANFASRLSGVRSKSCR